MIRRDFLQRFSAMLAGALAWPIGQHLPVVKSHLARRTSLNDAEMIDNLQLTVTTALPARGATWDLPKLKQWTASLYWKGLNPEGFLGKQFDLDWGFGNVRWRGNGMITLVEQKERGWYYIEVTGNSGLERTHQDVPRGGFIARRGDFPEMFNL